MQGKTNISRRVLLPAQKVKGRLDPFRLRLVNILIIFSISFFYYGLANAAQSVNIKNTEDMLNQRIAMYYNLWQTDSMSDRCALFITPKYRDSYSNFKYFIQNCYMTKYVKLDDYKVEKVLFDKDIAEVVATERTIDRNKNLFDSAKNTNRVRNYWIYTENDWYIYALDERNMSENMQTYRKRVKEDKYLKNSYSVKLDVKNRESFKKNAEIYYLSNNAIYKIEIPKNKIVKVFSAPKRSKKEDYYISNINCGMQDSVLFQQTKFEKDTGKIEKSIVAYNLSSKKIRTIVNLNKKDMIRMALSPNSKKIAISVLDDNFINRGHVIVINLQDNKFKDYKINDYEKYGEMEWSSDGSYLIINNRPISIIDFKKDEIYKTGIEGESLILSHSNELSAYLSYNTLQLIILNKYNKVVQKFAYKKIFVEDLISWMGDDNIILFLKEKDVEKLGFYNLKDNKIYELFNLPEKKENINSVCVKYRRTPPEQQ